MSPSILTAPAPVIQFGISVGSAGGIFVARWGSTMTINTFVQVTKIKGNRIYYKPIDKEVVSVGEYLAGEEMPKMNAFKGEERWSVLKQDAEGDYYFKDCPNFGSRRDYRVWFRQWNGKPCYFNHCD